MARGGGIVALTVSLAIVACTRSTSTPPAARPASPTASADPDAVDRLRALGYVGIVPAAADRQGSGVVRRDPRAAAGYSLFNSPNLCSAAVVDEEGRIANYWSAAPCARWASVALLPTGDLLVAGIDEGPGGPESQTARRYLMKLSWQGRILWKRRLSVHHAVEPLASGQLLVLLAQTRPIPEIDAALPVRDNRIALLSPDGTELESVSLYDLLRAAGPGVRVQKVGGARQGEIDLLHANALRWIAPAQVLVTIRHQDLVALVDWSAKRISWAWGQGQISGPHDGTVLPDGRLLVFDNGLSRGWSRVLEVDRARGQVVWSYAAPDRGSFFTVSRGSNQRLPNGNTLIAESDKGRAFEVTPGGEIVWEFLNPFRSAKGERAALGTIRRFERARIDAIVRASGPGRQPDGRAAAITGRIPANAASREAPD
jgi:hypothetical protein